MRVLTAWVDTIQIGSEAHRNEKVAIARCTRQATALEGT